MTSTGLKKIGKYDVEKILGRGGMGIVFKATDPALGRPVAIKMMTAGYSEDPDLLKRFYREAQFTGNLHHPNIVTVYDLGDLDGTPYFVMEFLEGESLDSIIASERQVSVLNKISYITQVCTGLEYAHRQRVIHRDIKPGNVMVMHDETVKIVDFGIARLGNDRLTRPQQVMGSYHYMSPEQINDKEIDARTDIFSTGVVLFQLLARRLPFEGEDVVSTLMKVINSPTPPLSSFITDYPPELDEIIGRALQKNKEDRYQSAEEFSFDLLQVTEKLTQQAIGEIVQRAEVFCEKGDLAAARQEALQALRVDRQNTRANELMRRIQQLLLKQLRVEQARASLIKAEEFLANKDFELALQSVEQAKTFDPSDIDLGKVAEVVRELKLRADKLRTALQQANSARTAGRLQDAKSAIEEALSIEPEDPDVLELERKISRDIEQERLAREAAERKKQESIRDAKDAIRRKAYQEAIDCLLRAKAEYPGNEFDDLLQFARSERENHLRELRTDNIIAEARRHLDADDYEKALEVFEAGIRDLPSQRLRSLMEEAQRRFAQYQSSVQEVINSSQHLLDLEKADQAVRMLQSQPASFSRIPEFTAALENARRMQARLQAIEAAKNKMRASLAAHDVEQASRLLEEFRGEFGEGIDFAQLAGEIKSEREHLQLRAFEAELAAAEVLSKMGSHEEALRTLDAASESATTVPQEVRARYDALKQQSVSEIERLKRETEARERARLEAQARERERKERERLEAEERARKEAEAKAKLEAAATERRAREAAEADARKRMEAEAQERERKDRERRAAEERAQHEAERRRRELQRQQQSDARANDDRGAGPESSSNMPYVPPASSRPPTGAPLGRDDDRTAMQRNKLNEPTVAELTPPLGVSVPGQTGAWPGGGEGISGGIPTDAIDPTAIEAPPPVILPQHRVSAPAPEVERPGVSRTGLIVAALLMVVVIGGALWFWLRPHAASPALPIQFASTPSGIQLRVNDQTCVSPCTLSLAEGDYVVNAQVTGQEWTKQPFSVKKGEGQKTVTVVVPARGNDTLRAQAPSTQGDSGATSSTVPPPASSVGANTGTLLVHTNVDQAKVFVDDKLLGTTTDGSFQSALQPKKYRVRVEKEGFKTPRSQTATIRKGGSLEAAFELRPAQPAAVADNGKVAQLQSKNEQPANAPQQPPASTAQSQPAQAQQQSAPPPVQAPAPPPVDDGSQLWASIGNSNRRSDFENFRNRFPNSPHAEQAVKKIEQLDWEAARDKKDESSIQAFLTNYPNGPFSDTARRELTTLQTQKQQSKERDAVISVIKQFEASYNGRDAEQLASVWPTLPKQELKKIRDSFKQANGVKMQLQYSDPKVSGDQATVACQRSVQFVFKEGPQPERTDRVTIHLHKTDGAWKVESVR